MGIQDRDYYREHLASQGKRSSGKERRPNAYAEALDKVESKRRTTEHRSGWAIWFAWTCLIFLGLVVCVAVWLARR